MVEAAEHNAKVTIIIVTYNADDFVRLCLDSIERYTTIDHEIIVVDNCSEPPLQTYLKQRPNLKLILNDSNKLWCEGNNQGIQMVDPECNYILLLNSDMEVRRADWLQRMVRVLASDEKIGMVGTAKAFARILPTLGGVDGQCMLIKKKLIDEIGLLDSERFPWVYAPIDFAARAYKNGYIYKIMPRQPELVIHYRGMSWKNPATSLPPAVRQDFSNFYDDVCDILRDAGLKPVVLPRFLWNIYKQLPGKPFFELTKPELRKMKGKS